MQTGFIILVSSCSKCRPVSKVNFSKKASSVKNPKKYSHTITLPKTNFPHRISPEKRVLVDSNIIKNYGFSELYAAQRTKESPQEEFVLHDGPPYANGVPHMGHAINKILKDIVIRWNLVSGKKIHYVPGWDCHGLPIELKALSTGNVNSLTPLEIRSKAREFAKRTLLEQKFVFRSWGIMADWDSQSGCYHTFDQEYIAHQLGLFYKLYEKGFIYRNLKPVYWSPSARTALAESELEYNPNHKSTAVTVKFRILNPPDNWGPGDVHALVWTTTPWTLPTNQAISFSPDIGYSVVKDGSGDRYLLASSLVPNVGLAVGKNFDAVLHLKGESLGGLKYEHPISRMEHSFFPGSHVTADVGTGLVHTAPSHGHDDFLIGINHNLPLESIVDENGLYTSEAGKDLTGLAVLKEGNAKVLELLGDSIIHKEDYVHSYPYDWRTRRPVIIRSSLQWFIDTNAIKSAAIEALQKVKIIPSRNVEGMVAQMERRPYWCISRQRSWGVPIPVLYEHDKPIINSKLIEHYQNLTMKLGGDFWWTSSTEELIPPSLRESVDLGKVSKGQDILDIWLDSGLSWSCVLKGKTADLYLEGVDQFTGWFQSSLLTSIALQGKAPFRNVLAHGFAVDEKGRKMSKSVGNVVDPQVITRGGYNRVKDPAYGVDVLRWWVASHGLQHTTIPASKKLLDDCAENVKRLRNMLKFLVGSIDDFPESLVYDPPHLSAMDKYFLCVLTDFQNKANTFYETYQYNKVCTLINNFVVNDLSSFYCHATKDRLYCDGRRSDRRKAVQYVMYHALNTLTKTFAPIIPILTEEVFSYHPHRTDETRPFFFDFDKLPPIHLEIGNGEKQNLYESIELVKRIKDELNKEIPVNLKSTEVFLTLRADPVSYELLKMLQEEEENCYSDLTAILQVSSVLLSRDEKATEYSFDVICTNYSPCERCRKFCVADQSNDICNRCEDVLEVCPTVDVSSI